MLPQAERLRRSGLFQRVYTARKIVSTSLFSLYVLAKQTRGSNRLPLVGFVASKKTLSKASDRNRAKRRLREAYRKVRTHAQVEEAGTEKENLRLGEWYAIVWVLQAKVLEVEFNDLVKSVEECLQKARQKFMSKGT